MSMNTSMKINYGWLAVGVIFGLIGLYELANGAIGGLLTLAISGLVIWTTAHNMGGWDSLGWELKRLVRQWRAKS